MQTKHEQVQLQSLHMFSTDWNTMAQQYNGMYQCKNRFASYVQQLQDIHIILYTSNTATQPVSYPQTQ